MAASFREPPDRRSPLWNRQFTECWQSLADGAIPNCDELVAHAPLDILRHLYVGSCGPEGALVIFEGEALTAIWGRDMTGQLIYANKEMDFRLRLLTNVRAMHQYRCGWLQCSTVALATGRHDVLFSTILPTISAFDGSELMACCCASLASDREGDGAPGSMRTESSSWIDLGNGTPAHAPLKLNG